MNQEKRVSDNEYGKRTMPGVGETLNPKNLFRFLWGFVSGWFLSRDYHQFFLGIPFVVFAFCGIVATWLLSIQPRDSMANAYERAAYIALRDDHQEEADLMWEQLMSIRPDEKRYQFTLLLSLMEQGKVAEAARHVEALTQPGEAGYAPARLWLVRHARGETPEFQLTTEQQVQQLQQAVDEDPSDPEAHRLLAVTYIERNDLRLAEQHLLGSVKRHPTLGLPLVQLQQRLGREDANWRDLLLNARRGYEELVRKDGENPQIRIGWAQTLLALQNPTEAEAILREGADQIDDPIMQNALADYYLGQAQVQLRQSVFRRDAAARLLVKAAQTVPGNERVAQACISLAGDGAVFTAEDLAPMLEQFQTRVEADEPKLSDRVTLAQLYGVVGAYDEAVTLIEADAAENRSVRSLLIRLLGAGGKTEAAEQLATELVAETRAELEAVPTDLAATLAYADALVTARRHADAVQLIDRFVEQMGRAHNELAPRIRQLYVSQCVASFEAAPNHDENPEAFEFLRKGVTCRLLTPGLLQRLARLSASEGPLAEKADDVLVGLVATGSSNSQIYTLVGTEYLQRDKPDRAADYLRRAYVLSPNDSQILNNYALALIRASRNNFDLALDLCKQALEQLPGHPDILSTRAEILIARSRWEEALADLETALPQREDSSNVRRLLVRVYTELGDDDIAGEHQRKLDELEHPSTTQGTTPETRNDSETYRTGNSLRLQRAVSVLIH